MRHQTVLLPSSLFPVLSSTARLLRRLSLVPPRLKIIAEYRHLQLEWGLLQFRALPAAETTRVIPDQIKFFRRISPSHQVLSKSSLGRAILNSAPSPQSALSLWGGRVTTGSLGAELRIR